MQLLKFIITCLFVLVKFTWCLPHSGISKRIESDLKPEDVLNVCLNNVRHKKEPSAEEDLTQECAPWKNNSCCTSKTGEKIDSNSLNNINYDMCPQKNMTDKCKRFFIRDTCFQECSPNGGLWKKQVDEVNRKERYYHVPLCQSQCDAWFEACAEDYTCSDNWSKNFVIEPKGTRIDCKSDSCKLIKEMFKTSKIFCENVLDSSWKVVNDNEPCMKINFNNAEENTNAEVTKKNAYKSTGSSNEATPSNDTSGTVSLWLGHSTTLLSLSFIFIYFPSY